MNKRLRELLQAIENKTNLAKGYMEGETKDVAKAGEMMNEVETLKSEYDVELKIYEAQKKVNAPTDDQVDAAKKANEPEVADGFVMIGKMLNKKDFTEVEKAALLSTTGEGTNGEENLLPHDVQLAIQELRRTHLSARDLLTVTRVSTLTGQTTYDVADTPTLSPLNDGDAIVEADAPKFRNVQWAIEWYAKLLPISRILVGAEKAGLMPYLNRWFVKSAINTENDKIFTAVKKLNTVKALKGWEALKKSINVDLDPIMLLDGVIVTNQTGFALLDEEKDENGRPILKDNPANPTQKIFQGLPIHVFPNAQLPDITKDTKAPIFYGSLKTALEFKEYEALQFGVSEHYLFNKNQNTMRVIEGFTIVEVDKAAAINGSFEASPAAPAKAKE